eukprot:g32583.t1
MCLHVQHGGNTSNSIPVREVPDSEAMDLDIMELNQWMHASGPAGRALARAIGGKGRHGYLLGASNPRFSNRTQQDFRKQAGCMPPAACRIPHREPAESDGQ